MHSPGSIFLSSDGHLDIYRDLAHNHFNIGECLLRLESRRETERTRQRPSVSPRDIQVWVLASEKTQRGPRLEINFHHELTSHNTNITMNDSVSL